jgi:hypothetical protein
MPCLCAAVLSCGRDSLVRMPLQPVMAVMAEYGLDSIPLYTGLWPNMV